MENIEKKIESFKTIEKINNYLNKIFECISNKNIYLNIL